MTIAPGTDYDHMLTLLTGRVDDPDADATLLLDAEFTPDPLAGYLHAWGSTPGAELTASALIRLYRRDITPEVLTPFAAAGYTSANTIIHTWLAHSDAMPETFTPAERAAIAVQLDTSGIEPDAVSLPMLFDLLTAQRSGLDVNPSDLQHLYRLASVVSRNWEDQQPPPFTEIAAAMRSQPAVDDAVLTDVIHWSAFTNGPTDDASIRSAMAAFSRLDPDTRQAAITHNVPTPGDVFTLLARVPQLTPTAAMRTLSGLRPDHEGFTLDVTLDALAHLVQRYPDLAGDSCLVASTPLTSFSSQPTTRYAQVGLARYLSDPAHVTPESLGDLDRVLDWAGPAGSSLLQEATVAIGPSGGPHPLQQIVTLTDHHPYLTPHQVEQLIRHDLPFPDESHLSHLDKSFQPTARRPWSFISRDLAEWSGQYPNADIADLLTMGLAFSDMRTTPADILTVLPDLTIDQLLTLLIFARQRLTTSDGFVLPAWLAEFKQLNPQASTRDIVAAYGYTHARTTTPWTDEQHTLYPLTEHPWRSRRAMSRAHDKLDEDLAKAAAMRARTRAAFGYAPASDYALQSGLQPGIPPAARGVPLPGTPVISTDAAARVDAVKARWGGYITDLDTPTTIPAIIDRDFRPLDDLLTAFTQFEDAQRTGTVAEQDRLAGLCEDILTRAEEQARDLGPSWLDPAMEYEAHQARARWALFNKLAVDPAATDAERDQAAENRDKAADQILTLATSLGGAAKFSAIIPIAPPRAIRASPRRAHGRQHTPTISR